MIYIHKGDDTDFNDNSFLTFNIVTEKDLTNWQAKFILNGLEKTFDDITSKSFELHYSDEETSQFKLGKTTNELKLIDEEGKIKTIAKNIDISVTNEVIENESQLINLPILKDEGIDINISLVGNSGGSGGTANHYELLYRDMANQHPISAITNLREVLDSKQDKDDYALKSEIPTKSSELDNDSNYTTQTDVLALIASIPQFKLSIVEALPEVGEKMILYFVPKKGTENDIYDEYVWIEQTSKFEFLGSTAIDLTDYAKKEELNAKQDILVSGTNIKTINNESILGSGNIEIKSASGSNHSMFDTRILDYILSSEENNGWIEQGKYVAKSVYPDFYNKCYEEFTNETNSKTWIKSNVTLNGSTIDTKGVLSSFSSGAYALMPSYFTGNLTSLEIVACATISGIGTQQVIIGNSSENQATIQLQMLASGQIELIASSVGSTSWDVSLKTINSVTEGEKYWVKVLFNTTTGYELHLSQDGATYELQATNATVTIPKWTEVMAIGNDTPYNTPYWRGSIDLKETYINVNGSRYWMGADTITQNPNGHIYYEIENETPIENVYAYGIDKTNELVLLPTSSNLQDYEHKYYRVL